MRRGEDATVRWHALRKSFDSSRICRVLGGLVVPITGEFSLVLPGRGRMPTIFARRTAIGGLKPGI